MPSTTLLAASAVRVPAPRSQSPAFRQPGWSGRGKTPISQKCRPTGRDTRPFPREAIEGDLRQGNRRRRFLVFAPSQADSPFSTRRLAGLAQFNVAAQHPRDCSAVVIAVPHDQFVGDDTAAACSAGAAVTGWLSPISSSRFSTRVLVKPVRRSRPARYQ